MMQLEFTFINEHGQKYTWRPDCKHSERVLQDAKRFKKQIDAVQLGDLADHDTPWACKGEPKLVEKRVRKPRARTPQPVNTSKKRTPRKKSWLVTPREFETVKHETLVKRLKNYYYEGGDRDIFLAYIRLMKLIYRATFLTVDRLIDPKDFYHEIKEIYSTTEPWSKQMMAALSDFRFMFQREEWTRLERRWQVQNREMKKRNKEMELTDNIEGSAANVTEPTTAPVVTDEEKEAEKLKRKNKKLQEKLQKFNNNGNKPKKKKRNFWF